MTDPNINGAVAERADSLANDYARQNYRRIDRMFIVLMIAQWAFAIIVAIFFSPNAWAGKVKTTHLHVYAALLLGGTISSLPIALALLRPGWIGTRHVIAFAQMLWSALLIHLSGGRIETHFHVFGSLAFLAFYRDWKVILTATVVVAADHLIRQIYWPESVYGVINPESWRFLEHAFWVVFEDTVLVLACFRSMEEMRGIALRQAQVEVLSESEREKTIALDRALRELRESHEVMVRTEKLAAVGQLAASVGHELRNPLAAIRNANLYIAKRLRDPKSPPIDPKMAQFAGVIDDESAACTKIITDLLDFARERTPSLQPCPLRPLVDDAIRLLPPHHVAIRNQVPETLPVPSIDKDQFRQILVNLLQNAVEAMPADKNGAEVRVEAKGGMPEPWCVTISDNGTGIPADKLPKIFEPLFTTKVKGTGLGLAVVANIIKTHKGTIRVESQEGRGTQFIIELPPPAQQQAA
jgi:signal transduction histidine kinase